MGHTRHLERNWLLITWIKTDGAFNSHYIKKAIIWKRLGRICTKNWQVACTPEDCVRMTMTMQMKVAQWRRSELTG